MRYSACSWPPLQRLTPRLTVQHRQRRQMWHGRSRRERQRGAGSQLMGAGLPRQRTVDALVIDGASGLQNQRLIHGHRDVVLDADGRAIVEDGRGRRHRAGTGIRAPRGEQKEHGKHDGHDFEPVLKP